jgi:hypothetical protein
VGAWIATPQALSNASGQALPTFLAHTPHGTAWQRIVYFCGAHVYNTRFYEWACA